MVGVRGDDLKLGNDRIGQILGLFTVKEHRMPLAVAAEHHIVGDIHVTDKPHAEAILGYEGKANTKLTDLTGRFVTQIHDLVLVEENLALVDESADLGIAHPLEIDGSAILIMEPACGRHGLDLGKRFVIEGNGKVLFRAVEDDLAILKALEPRDGLKQLTLTRARDARDTEHLTRSCGKADVIKHLDAVGAGHVQAAHLKTVADVFGHRAVDVQLDLLSDHHFGQLLLVRFGGVDGGDMLTLTQDGYAIRDLHNLVELMGDDNDRFPVRTHGAQNVKEGTDLLRRQDRRRLVQDQDIRAAVKHLDDLHRLLLGNRHLVDLLVGIYMEAVLLAHGKNTGFDFSQIIFAVVCAEHNIFGGGKHVDQLEVLMDHADLIVKGIARRGDRDLFPVNDDLTRIGIVNTRDHVHQSGLATAVLAENRQDLTTADIHGNITVGNHLTKGLGDVLKLDNGLIFQGFSSLKRS